MVLGILHWNLVPSFVEEKLTFTNLHYLVSKIQETEPNRWVWSNWFKLGHGNFISLSVMWHIFNNVLSQFRYLLNT